MTMSAGQPPASSTGGSRTAPVTRSAGSSHVTLKSIANNEPGGEEVLVDRPEVEISITRVSGPFTFEAMIPTSTDWEPDDGQASGTEGYGSFTERMLEVLRKSPI